VIGLSRRVRVFAYTRPVDMRKQYDGLYALVVSELNADPLSGDLFLFANRRRKRAKVLLWDDTGLCIRVAALFYSLIESAKLCGVEPRAYLGEATRRAIRNADTVTLPRDLR
jgi:transposase